MVSTDARIDGGIVVGHDGSRAATAVVRHAAGLARRLGVPLHVVRIWNVTRAPRPDSMVGGYVPPLAEFEQAVIADLQADCVTAGLADDHDLELELHAVRGQVADGLVTAAQHAEMLVIGSRGAGGFAGLRFGATATQVVRHSPVPVLIVPNIPD